MWTRREREWKCSCSPTNVQWQNVSMHVPLLTAGCSRANKPRILLTASEGPESNPLQCRLLVYSEDDLARCWQSNSFQAVSLDFINVISRCAMMLQKTALNRLQLKVDKLKRLKASIFYNVWLKKSAFEKFILVKISNSNFAPKMSPSGPISSKCVTLFWNVISPRTNQCNSDCRKAAAIWIIFHILSKWDQSCLMFCVWHINEQTDVALICVIRKI